MSDEENTESIEDMKYIKEKIKKHWILFLISIVAGVIAIIYFVCVILYNS